MEDAMTLPMELNLISRPIQSPTLHPHTGTPQIANNQNFLVQIALSS
jgi:hypothetical protein